MPWDHNGKRVGALEHLRDGEAKCASLLRERLSSSCPRERAKARRKLEDMHEQRVRRQESDDADSQRELVALRRKKLRLEIALLERNLRKKEQKDKAAQEVAPFADLLK